MPNFFGVSVEEIFQTEDVFIHDLRKSAVTQNPTISPDIDLVYILSGRSTALGADADRLGRAFDSSDDLERMRDGVRIAIQVNALRARKSPEHLRPEEFVTPILYNGREIHNQHLRIALDRGLFGYPKELFIPTYERADNFVDINLLEALTWINPAPQHIEQVDESAHNLSHMNLA